MPTLTLAIVPNQPALGLLNEPQLCYILAAITGQGATGRPVNWALVVDASRSMRIPIVDEAQFRALLRQGGAQETLVDGVPVWQLIAPVSPEIRAQAPSALEFVARALHSVVERLDEHDRFALIACAEEAVLLTRSRARAELARAIARLERLHLGEQTDLAQGMALGLSALRRWRAGPPGGGQSERLLLLTDGFTRRPEECLRLASVAAAEGIAISTIGLGGEFQEDLLTGLADRSAGRAMFLRRPAGIPRAIAAELGAARDVATRGVTLRVVAADGVTLRRVTRIRPALAPLSPAEDGQIWLGDVAAGAPIVLLLEFLAAPHTAGPAILGRLILMSDDTPAVETVLHVVYQGAPAQTPPPVLNAAARANAARLQGRALATAARGDATEAARLLRASAARLDDLGERGLAALARGQAATLEQSGSANALATKELAYATRRLGQVDS